MTSSGSLFNHSRTPNVSYTLDHETESIRYTTARAITKDEELRIFYGHKLWFEDADGGTNVADAQATTEDQSGDGWSNLPHIGEEEAAEEEEPEFLAGAPDEIIPEADLPFTRLKLLDDEEEDEVEAVRLGVFGLRSYSAWAG